MQRNLLLTVVLLAVGLVGAPPAGLAQKATGGYATLHRLPPREPKGRHTERLLGRFDLPAGFTQGIVTHRGGVMVPAVPGAPFSSKVLIEEGGIGTDVTRRTFNLVGRDAQGRTHGENRRMTSGPLLGMLQLSEVILFDPQTRLKTSYRPDSGAARQWIVPVPPDPGTAAPVDETFDDLGDALYEKLPVTGYRHTWTIPDPSSRKGGSLTFVDEYWYSDLLQMSLLIHRHDPRVGDETIWFTEIKFQEPKAEFFQIPRHYKVEQAPLPPVPPPAVGGNGDGGSTP